MAVESLWNNWWFPHRMSRFWHDVCVCRGRAAVWMLTSSWMWPHHWALTGEDRLSGSLLFPNLICVWRELLAPPPPFFFFCFLFFVCFLERNPFSSFERVHCLSGSTCHLLCTLYTLARGLEEHSQWATCGHMIDEEQDTLPLLPVSVVALFCYFNI